MSKKQKLITTLRDKEVKGFEFDEMFGHKRVKFYTNDDEAGTTFYNTKDVLTNEEVELIRQFAIHATLQVLEGNDTQQQPTAKQIVSERMKNVNILNLLGDK